jgi:hypothetical protein
MTKTLIAAMLLGVSMAVPANDSIYYVDASFSGCDAMGVCQEMRVESVLHALAMIGRDPIQSDSLSGAYMADLVELVQGRIDFWRIGGTVYAPRHVVVGFANDVFFASKRELITAGAEQIAAMVADISPQTIVWFLDYPPADGLNAQGRSILTDPEAYESWRAGYADAVDAISNARLIRDAYKDWQSSGNWHPLLPGGDYHLDQRSAIDAALRIYTALRDEKRPDW